MKLIILCATLAVSCSIPLSTLGKTADAGPRQPAVQIAILLDNSGSMSGLIAQAKSQLWSIVNEFIDAKQEGKSPRVEVALYEYGVNDLGRETGYIRKLSGLTDDLDRLSEQLFAISTRSAGSEEYCGWVMKDAVHQLEWDASPKTYKAIFIAGNEPFTQGPVAYQESCKAAIARGIMVNTIHCGNEAAGISGQWKEAAALADGKFLLIDHNAPVAAISAPQDKEIADLNARLNGTYLAYGSSGRERKERQEKQDANAAATTAAPATVAQRALTKASDNYRNATWDLIDRAKDADFDLAQVKEEELPDEMRKMSLPERKDYLAKKTAERADLQKRITQLAAERDKYVAEKSKESASGSTLGTAVSNAVREQAAKKGVSFVNRIE